MIMPPEKIRGYGMMPDLVLLKIRGIKILPFISLPFGNLDCQAKVVIYGLMIGDNL
jgi:hypothetical protein